MLVAQDNKIANHFCNNNHLLSYHHHRTSRVSVMGVHEHDQWLNSFEITLGEFDNDYFCSYHSSLLYIQNPPDM